MVAPRAGEQHSARLGRPLAPVGGAEVLEAAAQQLVHGRDVVRLEQLQGEGSRLTISTVQYSTVHSTVQCSTV